MWLRGGRLFVETFAHPGRGAEITSSVPRFFRELPADVPTEELGETLLEALEANYVEPGLGYPTDISEVVRVAGFEEYGPFYRGAKYVSVSESDDGTLTLIPTRNVARQGFLHDPDQAVVSSPDAFLLGRAVREALERSTTRR